MTTLTDRAVYHEEAAADLLEQVTTSEGYAPELVARAQAHATLAVSLRTAEQTAWCRSRWGS